MATRKRTNPPTSFADNANSTNPNDLPPSRPRKKPLRTVSPPLSGLSLNKLIYILVGLAILLMAFYSYRTVQYKRQVGGWWNLALGKRPPQMMEDPSAAANTGTSSDGGKKWWAGRKNEGSNEASVEDKINALAEALGMPPKELASAIAGAVKEYVPPASLSSVSSAAAKETGRSSEAVKVLLGEDEVDNEGAGVLGGIATGLGAAVGMDEPPEA